LSFNIPPVPAHVYVTAIRRLRVIAYNSLMNVLYVNGHPDMKSFHVAIRDHYLKGVDSTKHVVKVLDLGTLTFDPVLRSGYREHMPEDPVITESQKLVAWADHIIFTYPIWWGTPPSLLTGWIARTFTPGFAYNRTESFFKYVRRLTGKTSDLIVTSGTPRLLWMFTGNSGTAPFVRNLFMLTGIKKRKILTLSSMTLKSDTAARRQKFLEKVRKMAASL